MYKRILAEIFCILLVLFTTTCSAKNISDEFTGKAILKTIGERKNTQDSGAWWGENITKIVTKNEKTYTFVMDSDSDPRTVYMYRKELNGEWEEGESFHFSRPPNILIDTNNYIHVIGFEPFEKTNENNGRIVHIQFIEPNTIQGEYKKTFLTKDFRNIELTLENYGTYFCGAAIGSDDTILVAYTNSVGDDESKKDSLGVRIYNLQEQKWEYETVSMDLDSRYCYPFAFISDEYYHVYAVEDEYDEDYGNLGAPHDSYRYRYGAVMHFQKLRSGGEWQSEVILDFNSKPDITKKDIADMHLRIIDFHVDSHGVIHALLRYREKRKNLFGENGQCFHYWKGEDEIAWNSERIFPGTQVIWARIFETDDAKLFYVCSDWKRNIWLTSFGTSEKANITKIDGAYGGDPTPFINSRRSGSPLTKDLKIVIYSGNKILEALSVEISIK